MSLGAGLTFDAIEDGLIEAFDSSGLSGTNRFGTYFPYSDRTDWLLGVEVSFRLMRRLRVGIGLQGQPMVEVHGYGGSTVFETGPSETVRGTIYYSFIDWIVAPVDRRLWSRWEFSAGGGVSYAEVSASGSMGSDLEGTVVVYGEPWEQSERKFGCHLRSSLDYYIAQSLSLGLNARLNLIPAVDVGERVFRDRTLEAHSIGLTGFVVLLRLSVCLW